MNDRDDTSHIQLVLRPLDEPQDVAMSDATSFQPNTPKSEAHQSESGETAKKFIEDDEPALPDTLYPLIDGSYGDRTSYDAQQVGLDEADRPHPWGKGALLLNTVTKSYLTPFGFKAVLEHNESMIHDSFERAGLDPNKSYYNGSAPDILIHGADGRFIPSIDLLGQDVSPLPLRFREEDIYLQNFSYDGSKHTGSYTRYSKADHQLRERYATALAGGTRRAPVTSPETSTAEPALPEASEKKTSSSKHRFVRTSRDKRRSARSLEPREHKAG